MSLDREKMSFSNIIPFPQNGAVGVEVWTCFLFQLGWHQEQCELASLEKEGGGQECFYVEGLLKRSIFMVVKYNMPIEDPYNKPKHALQFNYTQKTTDKFKS